MPLLALQPCRRKCHGFCIDAAAVSPGFAYTRWHHCTQPPLNQTTAAALAKSPAPATGSSGTSGPPQSKADSEGASLSFMPEYVEWVQQRCGDPAKVQAKGPSWPWLKDQHDMACADLKSKLCGTGDTSEVGVPGAHLSTRCTLHHSSPSAGSNTACVNR